MSKKDLVEDSVEYILYVNGKAAAKYNSESEAFNDMTHLKHKGYQIKLMKQVCNTVPLDESAVHWMKGHINESTDTNDLLEMLKRFLPIVQEHLQLKSFPKIKPVIKLDHGAHPSFGMYVNETNTIEIAIANRHPVDILRTLAHELVHCKQREDNRLKPDSGETGSEEENEANARAGIIMRDFDDANPEVFDETPLQLTELDEKPKPKSWDDYGQPAAPAAKKPEEKVYKGFAHYFNSTEKKPEKEKVKVKEDTDYVDGNVEYHDTLNPLAWQNNSLRKEVRTRLLEIAKVFVDYLDVPNFEIADIVLTGSLANYNYTEHSDFDLHIITDYADLQCEDLAAELYNAKKHIWNDAHDITIRGHEVEMYVEDINKPPVSSGVFSVLSNKWLKEPTKENPEIDTDAVNNKVRDLVDQIYRALATADDAQDIRRLIEKLRKMRRSALDVGGEFSVENLAYKVLRNEGYIQHIYDTLISIQDQQLTMKEGFTPLELAIMEGGHSL